MEDDDIIIRFNGVAISRAGELPHWVGRTPVGEESEVIVVREGKEVKLKVVLGELPENPRNASRSNGGRPAEEAVLGITVRDLAANRLEELGVDAGAEVIAVSGIAEDAGMRVGDVVLRMKGKVIANAEALKEVAVSAESGDVVPVLVLRVQGNSVRRSYLTLRVPEDE